MPRQSDSGPAAPGGLGSRADRRLLYRTAFLRAVTTSLVAVLIGVNLGRVGLSTTSLGGIVSAGLFGATLAAMLATFAGDRIGRRRLLIALALLSALGTCAFAFAQSALWLGVAAFVGMLNGMGKDRGAALILEQAMLPGTTTAGQRTRVIAGYTMLQDLGHALGALLAGLPAWLASAPRPAQLDPQQLTLLACATISLIVAGHYLRLSGGIELARERVRHRLTAHSRSILIRISSLFAIDSLAGGFLTTALLSYFFFARFGVSELWIGGLFFGARLLNAVSHLGAAYLARRFGLVNTMVFTHIPSSILLVTVAFAPNFPVAALLFLLREGLVEMDVPTRQSYVLAVVEPEERTLASGITNLVRLSAWAVAPVFAGALGAGNAMVLPLCIGAGMKIGYDLLLWRAFRSIRPPEER